jgi:class 3 adenylate cyclase/predicted ATPase/tRNA A37 threonylcarbamoyladenosine biosynthesis protein TsaE
MDVGGWLRSLGLGKYEAAFRDHEIDETVLPSLTHENLKELGITALGHRLKLLDAITALGTHDEARDAATASSAPRAHPEDRAERRQVTVMFSDLVGSTALSARMDPEDLREVISTYQKCVAETVRRSGGFVAKYMGDGVLIYFGYPQAHEDDAERAVRAGLQLIAAVTALKSHVPLQTRVGIATGLVVVGDLIGSGEAQEHGIVGETPNLAARLQGMAEPNSVIFAEDTRKLLGNLFELQDLGAKDLKGIAGAVRAWSALRPASVEGRFEAIHAGGLTALVGREEEIELLARRWARAKGGEGQVVLLSGEAGIGKSRLTAALLERVAGESHTRLRYFCSPQHTDSAFYPVIGQMERAAGLVHDDTARAKLDKLDILLARTSISKQDAALFAEMLSFPNDGRYPALELTAQQRRQKTMEALGSQMEELSRQFPVLMIFEDAHWTDPTTLELFGRAVDRIAELRVLLLVTFRPEFQPPWIGRSHVAALTLNRLTQHDITALIDGVVGNKHLPANVRQDIIERADGIPLFIEEMTKAVLEAESESEARRTAAAIPSPTVAVPASLHASLMARLDRLGPAKEVAQIGAAIGREFSHNLLASVASRNGYRLVEALDRLVEAGLVLQQGVPPEATYLFKHALVRDAAYGTLLRQPRRDLHLRIATAIEEEFPEIAQSRPEMLAHHFTEGGLIKRAAMLWGEIGQRSLARSALVEAASQLSRALDLVGRLPGTPALRREQIKFQVELVTVLMHVKGYGAPETKLAADRALALIENAEALGEPPEDSLLLFSVLYGLWVVNVAAFNGAAARELAAQFLALAEKQRTTGPQMLAHRMMGMTMLSIGHLAEGRAHLDRALALYDPAEHRALATRFGTDARVASLEWRSRTLWLQGYPDAALKDVEDSFKGAQEIGQAATMMHALAHSTLSLILCGDYSAASVRARELVVLAEEKGSLYWKANAMMWQGCVSALTGRAAEAIEILTPALVSYRSTAATIYTPFVSLHLARACAELGQLGEAWHHIDEATTAAERTQEKWVEAEIHRTAGEIAFISPEADAAKARACFERALVVAREQKAKSWELRTTTSLARLWRDQGELQLAHDLLTPVYGWFTEGFRTRDLREAKALLDALSS